MSPFWQAAVCMLAILLLGFAVGMVLLMFEYPAAKKRDTVISLILMLMIPCLVFLAGCMEAMRGTELLTDRDFVVDKPYEIIDQPIEYPDSKFVAAIQDSRGAIKLYRLNTLPMDRRFVYRVNYITQRTWYEPASKGR